MSCLPHNSMSIRRYAVWGRSTQVYGAEGEQLQALATRTADDKKNKPSTLVVRRELYAGNYKHMTVFFPISGCCVH